MTTQAQCSEYVQAPGGWHNMPCSKAPTVTRDGKPYCTIHDPERRKAREQGRCYHRGDYGSQCGAPAVEVNSVGFGRCALHAQAHLAYIARLHGAAEELLAACKAALFWGSKPQGSTGPQGLPVETLQKLEAAIAVAEGEDA